MGILKFLSLFLRLFREMVFDHPDETDFTSPRFNARKMIVVAALMFLLVYSAFTTEKLYELALERKQLELKLEQKAQCKTIG